MSALTLFSISHDTCERLKSNPFSLERDLQKCVEKHLEALLGVRLLVSEFPISGGRIDTLGLDENGSPVVIEYKRGQNDNVVMQGLFYIDWIVKNKAEYTLLVQKQLGMEIASSLNFSDPRLICIAENYSRYHLYGVQQIPRPIELLRYHNYPNGLLLLERVGGAENHIEKRSILVVRNVENSDDLSSIIGEISVLTKTNLDELAKSNFVVKTCYALIEDFLFSLGSDVLRKPTKTYVAFRKVKNFVCVQALKGSLALNLRIDPASVILESGFSRDVTQIGHNATGNLELAIRTLEDVDKALPLLQRAYDEGL